MNIEMNKEVAQPQPEAKRIDAPRRKKRKAPHKKAMRPSVVYPEEELSSVEGVPFWNAVHDGQIKDVNPEGVMVSVARDGGQIDVFVPIEELQASVNHNVGQPIRIYLEDAIAAQKDSDRPFSGSEIKAVELDLLDKAYRAHANNETIKGYVVGEIKGGYCVALFASTREDAEVGFGLRAFLPLGRTGLRRNEGLNERDDRVVEVQITELDPRRGNIVVSRRELLAEGRKKEEEAFFVQYQVGDEVTGVVTALMPYGVFVNLGAVDGFLHISDISWDKKPRVKELVPEGKEIRAKIIGIDSQTKKVKLSMKELNADPWQSIEKTFKAGSEVEGTIVAFADFGAFVKLKDGVEGLIHLGEITWNRIKHPSQHFRIGDHVRALVLRVDKEARRISLSTKALEMSPVERLSGQFPVGAVLKTKIVSIHDFGLFVELDDSSEGFVPRSETSWVRSEEPLENSFSVGQEVEVAVLGYDARRQRVSCSIKRAKEDPWHRWKSEFRKGSTRRVKVLEVKRAGVVCELDGDLTGFCPRSQMADSDNDQIRPNIKVGDEIDVVVTACDLVRHRVSLSQKAAAESETKKAYESYLNEQGRGSGRTTLGDAFRNVNKFKGKSKDHG
jgi:small subunit ribosomal protein S1